jgi:outer membrane protein
MQARLFRPAALAVVLSLAAAGAYAQQPPNTFKIGAILYQPHSKTDGIRGIGVPPGADAEVGSATTLLLTYERALTPNVGVEIVLGVPPRIKSKATGSVAYLGDDVLSAKNVAPTLFVTYHFGAPGDRLRPYVGLGVNYTHFASPRSTLADNVELADSTGLAAHLGADYAVANNWGLFASIARVDVKSKLVATGTTVLETTIDFRPITYSIGAYYRF